MQVGNFIHYLSTFLAGLVVGFVSAWRLALLSVAVIPGIAFAGGLYAYTITGLTSKSRESYANAGIIAEQVCPLWPVSQLFISSKEEEKSKDYCYCDDLDDAWMGHFFVILACISCFCG